MLGNRGTSCRTLYKMIVDSEGSGNIKKRGELSYLMILKVYKVRYQNHKLKRQPIEVHVSSLFLNIYAILVCYFAYIYLKPKGEWTNMKK